MDTVNRDFFFSEYRKVYGGLTQGRVDGMNAILDGFDNDSKLTSLKWLAYAFATVKHETDNTYKAIREYGRGKGKAYGVPKANGNVYYGRGLVQLTWDYNYINMGKELGVDLYGNPDLALDSKIAVDVMFAGMRKGIFTTRKFADYFSATKTDWVNARRIINGTDKAKLIAEYAADFYDFLEYNE